MKTSHTIIALLAAALAGCSSPQPEQLAPPETFEPAGWLDVERSFEHESFDGYAADIRRERNGSAAKAVSSFNPHFDKMTMMLDDFLD